MTITRATINDHFDFQANKEKLFWRLHQCEADPREVLRFLHRYTAWNSVFGSGVATLAGLIGQARRLFKDHSQSIPAIADRSVLIASYVFDAARDEFDDRENPLRDTHRCLAQSLIIGIHEYLERTHRVHSSDPQDLTPEYFPDMILEEAVWLRDLQSRAMCGYGYSKSCTVEDIFHSLGYHVASEVFADQEFSIIDRYLRDNHPKLVSHLESTHVKIEGVDHIAYHWIRIHSGEDTGGGVEDEHFQCALTAINLALKFAPPEENRDDLMYFFWQGFNEFARDHAEFFEKV